MQKTSLQILVALVENAGGITIENLVVVGGGITNNTGYGILCDNTLTNATMLD